MSFRKLVEDTLQQIGEDVYRKEEEQVEAGFGFETPPCSLISPSCCPSEFLATHRYDPKSEGSSREMCSVTRVSSLSDSSLVWYFLPPARQQA